MGCISRRLETTPFRSPLHNHVSNPQAIAKAGYEGKVKIAMDVAASEFFVECSAATGGQYDLDFKSATKSKQVRCSGTQRARSARAGMQMPCAAGSSPTPHSCCTSLYLSPSCLIVAI